MTASWPATLPAFVQERGYSESLPDMTVESTTDAGPPKTRRRFTAGFRPIAASIVCDPTQKAAFETFFLTTLKAGALPFTWVNPFTQQAETFRFRRPPPAYQPAGGDNVAIAMNLWQLP